MRLSFDAVRARHSVRSYDAVALGGAEIEALKAAFDEALPAPFGTRPRFALVAADEGGRAARMGTYGLISGAPAYVVGAAPLAPGGMEDFGYAMEGIVLRATELGLGSCWLGGVFDRGRAARALGLGAGEVVAAALALGRPAERRSLADRVVAGATGARGRKRPDELFFAAPDPSVSSGAAAWPLLPPDSPWRRAPLADLLEAVRLAPSASNKQPWRLVLETGARPSLHLYLHEDSVYNKALAPVHIQRVDMGIAMRHIEVAALVHGLGGAWRRHDPDPYAAPAPQLYIASFHFA